MFDTERQAIRRIESRYWERSLDRFKKEDNQSALRWYAMMEEATERKREGNRVITIRTHDKYYIHKVMNWERDQELKGRRELIREKRKELRERSKEAPTR